MSSREQFEEWMTSLPGFEAADVERRDDGKYSYSETEWCWKSWQASRQALEIALPVLEQQEKGDDSAELINGWVEWDGGECPVIPGNRVDLKLRGGFITQDFPAEAGEWNHYGGVWDIIAYRVVQRGEEA